MNDENKRLIRRLSLALIASMALNCFLTGAVSRTVERAWRDAFATVIARFHQPATGEGGAQ